MAYRRDSDKARETRQLATPYEEHRKQVTDQEAKLEQTDLPEEGELEPEVDDGPEAGTRAGDHAKLPR
jgi:hypothetical protein